MAGKVDVHLFRYLKGEITYEEWEQLRSESEQGAGDISEGLSHVTVSGGEASSSGKDIEITGVSGLPMMAKDQIKEETTGTEEDTTDMDDDDDDDDVIYVDTETTIKYLKGEILFEEFQSMLESGIKEEPVEDIALQTEVTTTEAPSTSAAGKTVSEQDKSVEQKQKKRKTRKTKLPKHLQGLMGEANMKFARREHDETIKMCMEVIRLAPTAQEPFQTLGMLYEELGDNEKALQFLLIAAHLNPSDPDEWVKLAEMSLELGNIKQAITCYDKAIKYDAENMTLLWARCDLYEKLGDQKRAMDGYQQILNLLPKDDGDKYIQLSRDMAKNLHASGNIQKALSTMATAFKEHPAFVNAEDVNLLLELYISQGVHDKPVEVLIQHCGVTVTLDDNTLLCGNATGTKVVTYNKDKSPIFSCSVPDELPIDLRIKLVVCLIYLNFKQYAQALVLPLYEENPDEVGDLYFDVAEAYMEMGCYRDAEPILAQLVHSYKYNLAAVWLRYGECLNSLGHIQQAADAYGNVVELAPTHMAARVSLSALQQQLGRYDDALHTLQQEVSGTDDAGSTPLDLRLELPRCLLLLSQGRLEEFIVAAKHVLFYHFMDMFTPKHMSVILGNKSQKHRINSFKNIMGLHFEQRLKDASNMLSESTYTVDDLWDLYIKLCESLIDKGDLEQFLDISIMSLLHPIFMGDQQRILETEFLCLIACLLNKNGHFAYNFIREICVKQLENNQAWNLFCQIVTLSQDFRHNRFCMRLMLKHPNHLALGMLNGHNALVAGTYKHALGEYVTALRQDPRNPLLSLCIGLTFLHMASQKFAAKRHSLIIQGCSFLNQYMELRGECQESCYNLGRAMHQIGLGHAAVYYYQKALTFGPAIKEEAEVFDLSREIAFNLSLIYQTSGSDDLAAMIVQKHLIV